MRLHFRTSEAARTTAVRRLFVHAYSKEGRGPCGDFQASAGRLLRSGARAEPEVDPPRAELEGKTCPKYVIGARFATPRKPGPGAVPRVHTPPRKSVPAHASLGRPRVWGGQARAAPARACETAPVDFEPGFRRAAPGLRTDCQRRSIAPRPGPLPAVRTVQQGTFDAQSLDYSHQRSSSWAWERFC